MFEDLFEEVIENDKTLRAKVKAQMSKIMSSDKFMKILEEKIFEVVKNFEFDDTIYDLIDKEEMLKPVVLAIKKKLQEVF